jgi:hypothetical protein
MSVEDEVAIKVWLVHIEETDPAIIASVLHQMQTRWTTSAGGPATCRALSPLRTTGGTAIDART